MKRRLHFPLLLVVFLIGTIFSVNLALSQDLKQNPELDKKVEAFLEAHQRQWWDMNVPKTDGKILHDLILKHGYTRALEIGTSTGHSGIWIAWALSKTGGKLVTIEIDKDRHAEAVRNFKEVGLSDIIDARLADAHELVPKLDGPFDFVFCDADKDWYTNYFKDVLPKMTVNGCFAAHNVSGRGRRYRGGTGEFYDYVTSLQDVETTLIQESRSGISVSYKRVKE